MSYLVRFLCTALCFATFTLFGNSTSAAAFKRVQKGDAAPALTLPDLTGTPVGLENHREGPLTILCFWALWSPKSVPLLEDVQKLLDEFGEKGLKALAVNAEGQETPADLEQQVQAFAEKHGLKFPMLLDKGLVQYNEWGVIATPSTALLGKDLVVVYEFSGHPTSAYLDMREHVMETLGISEQAAEAVRPKRERYAASKKVMLSYGLARTLYERGQLSKAKRKLAKVLEEDPAFPDAHALSGAIGLGLDEKEDPNELAAARAAFQKAVELDKTVPLGLAGLAHFALSDGDVAKALELARSAVDHTEPAELPSFAPAAGTDPAPTPSATAPKEGAPSTDGKPEQAKGGETDEAKTTPVDESQAPGSPPDAVTRLDRAAKAVEAGNTDEARVLVEEVVDALLALPEGPRMKAKGLMLKLKKEGE